MRKRVYLIAVTVLFSGCAGNGGRNRKATTLDYVLNPWFCRNYARTIQPRPAGNESSDKIIPSEGGATLTGTERFEPGAINDGSSRTVTLP
jgi:hypothetical protein